MNSLYYFVAMLVILVLSLPLTGGAQNLVKSGNFETLDGWKMSNERLVELDGSRVVGRNCVKITSEPKAGVDEASTSIWQDIDIKEFDPDGEYRLSFSAISDHFPQEYNIFMGVMQGEQLPVVIGSEWRQVGTTWQDVELDFRDVNPVATTIRLRVQVKAPGSVWVDNLKIVQLPKGTISAKDKDLKDLPKYAGSAPFVQITADRRFVVDGKPFFPIGMWGIDFPGEQQMKDLQAYGFNVSGTGHLFTRKADGTKQLLDMAQTYGLRLIGVMRFDMRGEMDELRPGLDSAKNQFEPIIEVTSKHPAFFAYDIADEPAWAGNNLAAFSEGSNFIRDLDPNHPIFSNQAPRQAISLLSRYYRFVDIGGSDIYPYWNGELDRHSDLPNKTLSVVGDECRKNLEAVGPDKPVLMTLQAFGWSDGKTDEATKAKGYAYPPTELLRFMTYDAITAGATGILMFQDQRYSPNIDARVKPVSLELRAMHDVLAAENAKTQAEASSDRIKLLTKVHDFDTYIIAVNTTDKEIETTISLPKATANWTAIFENKKFKAKKRAFTDTFKPWQVHIYTDAVDSSRITKIEADAAGK